MIDRLIKGSEVFYWIVFVVFTSLVIYEAAIFKQPLGQLIGDDPNRPVWPLAMGWFGPAVYLAFRWWRQHKERT